jgi:hypothetical protein
MKELPFLTEQKTEWKTAIMNVHYKIMLDIPVVLSVFKLYDNMGARSSSLIWESMLLS